MRYLLAVLLTVCCISGAFAEAGYREVRSGNSAFDKGDFQTAVGAYQKAAEKNPAQPVIDYDLGTAYYKAGDYDKAVEFLQKGLLSDDVKVVGKAHFNLGNALYKAGTAREDKDISGAIKSLESALPHYDKVIAQDPKGAAAPANKDFVTKELERLKKKQQEQKQQKQQKKGQSGQEGQSGPQEQSSPRDQQDSPSQGEVQDQGQDQAQPQAEQGSGSDQQKDQHESAGQQEGSQDAPSQGEDQKGASSPEKDSASSGQAAQGQILSQKEAKTLLDDFDQNEQPKGLLNFIQRQGSERPVEKDW